ncbi:MAG: Na-translocating system protein MpsC family protein [Cyanobacteria bacterium P01_A01_bin.40]
MDIKNNNLPIKAVDLPTLKQLERTITQKFHALYRLKIGCSPRKATCTIFKNYLVIVAEDVLSPLELTIKNSGQAEFLEEIRQSINRVIRFELRKLLEEIAKVEIVDLVCKRNLDSNRIIAIAILSNAPQVRRKSNIRL